MGLFARQPLELQRLLLRHVREMVTGRKTTGVVLETLTASKYPWSHCSAIVLKWGQHGELHSAIRRTGAVHR